MKTSIKLLMTTALILLFTYAAVSKLASVSLFRAQLHLQPFSHSFADLLVFAIPAIELIAVALLLADRTRDLGLLISVVLLAAFTITYILVLYAGKLPCSCGGILSRMSWGAHLVFNCFFLAAGMTALGIRLPPERPAASR
jgi:energy-converting hydrogenase Eha subunit A